MFPVLHLTRSLNPLLHLCFGFRQTRLDIPETSVETLTIEQVLVGTRFGNFALIHHINAVGVANRRKAVGDRDRRPVLGNFGQGFLDRRFRFVCLLYTSDAADE